LASLVGRDGERRSSSASDDTSPGREADAEHRRMIAAMKKPLAPKELAELLGRSERWVQRACRSGAIRTFPIGRPYRIPAEEVDRLLSPPCSRNKSHPTN
jgi:excisionase family DNA binding protein